MEFRLIWGAARLNRESNAVDFADLQVQQILAGERCCYESGYREIGGSEVQCFEFQRYEFQHYYLQCYDHQDYEFQCSQPGLGGDRCESWC